MVKASAFLDTIGLPDSLREDIVGIGGDPDFVGFVLAWHGVIGSERVPFTHDRPSQTIIRRTKRRLQKVWGHLYHKEWKNILYEWRKRPKLILQRTLFKLEPQPENPPHRSRSESKWMAVCDLRNYFKGVTGQPKMELIRRALGLGGVYGTFNPEWQRRKSWFDEKEAADRLDRLKAFYSINHERILETLKSGIPLYERHCQNSPVKTE
ncbi:MAG: hypothetical protein O7F12_03205 [Nitrospirae bacterium]|nr:hypothetical protein [Nitrospirota bacterium]